WRTASASSRRTATPSPTTSSASARSLSAPRTVARHGPPSASDRLLRARRVHDDGDAGEAEERADDVPAVRSEAVHDHAPRERPGDEHPAVRGEDAAEVRVGLQRRDDAVEPERDDARADPQPAPVLAQPLPHEPRPA